MKSIGIINKTKLTVGAVLIFNSHDLSIGHDGQVVAGLALEATPTRCLRVLHTITVPDPASLFCDISRNHLAVLTALSVEGGRSLATSRRFSRLIVEHEDLPKTVRVVCIVVGIHGGSSCSGCCWDFVSVVDVIVHSCWCWSPIVIIFCRRKE